MENDRSKAWNKISETLFSAKPEPVSEAFVQSVMDRLEAEARPRLVRVPAQWFAPVVGVAAMLLLTLLPARGAVSVETMILGTDRASLAAFGERLPETDEMLGFVMEEK